MTMNWVNYRQRVEAWRPPDNPTFGNPEFQAASYRVLIVRLSPFRDVDRSMPHLFLFHEVRHALPEAFIDMAFFPSASERKLFEQNETSFLNGVQSLRPATDFDLLLISNAYTLELINLPYLLIHSGIPLFSSQRQPQKAGAEWPIIILGGSNAMATQSIIRAARNDSLVDGIFFGEGEGWVGSLASFLSQNRQKGKMQVLEQAAIKTPGLWIAGSPRPVQKAILREPTAVSLPVTYPILDSPEARTAHLQINYGCPAFCSFCFEGYDRKPYRELALADILSTARQIKRAQGAEELNLYSFNFNTHQDILPMILDLHRLFDRVSFKSQRVDILQRTPGLLEAEIEADKREFTLGVEGISARLRTWLHKSLPVEDITSLLNRLFMLKARRVKLFYVLTGYETDADIAEFRQFLHWLKGVQRSHDRQQRVVFSFGLLIRMPGTPLQYDRLFLDEPTWRLLIGQVKSACETHGFEFRLAFGWADYCVSQVLALGGHWLVEPVVALAQQGYCFDAALPPEYWDKLRAWMEDTGRWNDALLGKKGPDYPFPLEFVEPSISDEFLYRQYQDAQAGVDDGYCLGIDEQAGRCLGCGACVEQEQKRAITHHQIHRPERGAYATQLRDVMVRKRRLQPAYLRLRLEPWLAGVLPAFLDAFVFKGLLAGCPELVDNLLSVRESLFTLRPNARRFPPLSGETIFALKAWDVEALENGLLGQRSDSAPVAGFEIVGPADGFVPGVFTRLRLDMHLPGELFPQPRARLEEYLRGEYVRYSVRREGERYRFDLPLQALKKKILWGGFFESREDGAEFFASLDVGAKFDLMAFLQTFDGQEIHRHARVQISEIEW